VIADYLLLSDGKAGEKSASGGSTMFSIISKRSLKRACRESMSAG
jgi:hypothetical protein